MKNLLFTLLVSLNLISCTTPNCDKMYEDWSELIHRHNQTIMPLKSFVKVVIFIKINEQVAKAGSGSGFFISKNKIVTARHVCDKNVGGPGSENIEATEEPEVPESEQQAELPKPLPIVDVVFGIETYKGEQYRVNVVKISPDYDLCILETEEEPKDIEVIKLSPVAPRIGEKIYNIAAPHGFSTTNMVPIFEGFYSGDIICDLIHNRCSVYTMPIKGGSSGSPVINEHGEVIGVVFAGDARFHEIAFSCTYRQLKNFIKDEI